MPMAIETLITSSLGSGITLEVLLLKYKKHRKKYFHIFFSAFHRFSKDQKKNPQKSHRSFLGADNYFDFQIMNIKLLTIAL